MPGPYVVPVHGDADLPKEVDVVIIGGGIIGTSTALEFAERGLKVDYRSVWEFVHAQNLTFKKNAGGWRAGSSGRGAKAPAMA